VSTYLQVKLPHEGVEQQGLDWLRARQRAKQIKEQRLAAKAKAKASPSRGSGDGGGAPPDDDADADAGAEAAKAEAEETEPEEEAEAAEAEAEDDEDKSAEAGFGPDVLGDEADVNWGDKDNEEVIQEEPIGSVPADAKAGP